MRPGPRRVSTTGSPPPEVAFATQNELQAFLHELVERRQREPGDDLTAGLVQARGEGDKLTTDELAKAGDRWAWSTRVPRTDERDHVR
ncbi:hypothetical protein ACIBQ1_39385 [Nonomuraea sp. NPDC050153]|uniref:hypothetical protein n=1 Tax=Nonomuraea sp. NPDC050153 TaxID=3364359 RepID=UPI0037BAE844